MVVSFVNSFGRKRTSARAAGVAVPEYTTLPISVVCDGLPISEPPVSRCGAHFSATAASAKAKIKLFTMARLHMPAPGSVDFLTGWEHLNVVMVHLVGLSVVQGNGEHLFAKSLGFRFDLFESFGRQP